MKSPDILKLNELKIVKIHRQTHIRGLETEQDRRK